MEGFERGVRSEDETGEGSWETQRRKKILREEKCDVEE